MVAIARDQGKPVFAALDELPVVLKEERQQRILELVAREGRVVATELQERLGVSGYTIRRDLDELAEAAPACSACTAAPLPRSTVAPHVRGARAESVEGKSAAARAAATLLEPGPDRDRRRRQHRAAARRADPARPHRHLHHAQPAGRRRARRRAASRWSSSAATLDRRAMVASAPQTIDAYGRITADVCFLGLWSIHATAGISSGYYEEAEVRRVMIERADRVVGLASQDKLGTVAPFTVAPATALTHLATEPDAPAEQLRAVRRARKKAVR